MAFDTEKKINRLVAPLVAVLDNSGVGRTPVRHQKNSLLGGLTRCVVYRNLFNISGYPVLLMGVHKDSLAIWLETPAGSEKKAATQQAIESVKAKLRDWTVFADGSTGYDLELRVPLSVILSVPDQEAQEAYVKQFFTSALEDMKQAGVVEAIEQALRG
jgi:hypothetical protein